MVNYVVDSSVWIDFFNNKSSSQIEKVKSLIPTTAAKGYIYVLPVIMQEVLQGIQDDKLYQIVEENLFGFKLVDYNAYEFALKSAELFRMLRKKGLTIRKANDCLIAAICIENNFTIIHNDKDFDHIAKYTKLKIYK